MFLAGLPSKHLPSFWTIRVLCMYMKRSLLGSLVAFMIRILDDEAVLHIVKDVDYGDNVNSVRITYVLHG